MALIGDRKSGILRGISRKIMLERKLRMPLTPILPHVCKCGKRVDRFGDHFYECSKYGKNVTHNRKRDAHYLVLSKLIPLNYYNFLLNAGRESHKVK